MESKRAAELFVDSKRNSGRADATISLYSLVLRRFSECFKILPSQPEPIETWIAAIEGQPETRHAYYRTIRTFYNWLEVRHKVVNPLRYIEAPILPSKLPRYLTAIELITLLEHPGHSKRDKALLYFLADTGARASEAASITCESIKEGWVLVNGKRGQRFLPLSPVTRYMVNELMSEGPIWRGRLGPLTVSGVKSIVRRCMRAAGLEGPKLGPHLLRHTFGTLWTGEELVLQSLLGHTSLAMTKRYRQLRATHIGVQHRRHSPLKLLPSVNIMSL